MTGGQDYKLVDSVFEYSGAFPGFLLDGTRLIAVPAGIIELTITDGVTDIACPHVVAEGSDRVALNVLKALLRGPMRPVELRDMLGIASRSYFTLQKRGGWKIPSF